jgi:hypothetical protein
MKTKLIISLAAILSLSGAAFSQTLPEPPAIWREVTGVRYQAPRGVDIKGKEGKEGLNPNTADGWYPSQYWGIVDSPVQPRHTRPHIPAFRTTADGRIGMRTLGLVGFSLLNPEKLTTTHATLVEPIKIEKGSLVSKNNSFVLSDEGYKYIRHEDTPTVEPSGIAQNTNASLIYKDHATDADPGGIGHWTLYDPTPTGVAQVGASTDSIRNPKKEGNNDIYDLKVIGSITDKDLGLRFCTIDIKVTVVNPKTESAAIESVIRQGPPNYSPWIPVKNPNAFELNVAADGRLLVLRIGPSKTFKWKPSGKGTEINNTTTHNIVYSYNRAGLTNNLLGFNSIQPFTHAPFDTRINATAGQYALGFALSKFRDASGTLIPDGAYFDATYPWIDRDAKNLFLTVLTDGFKWGDGINEARYPYIATPGQWDELTGTSEGGSTQGVSFMGKWSHGKMVLLDGLLNDMDSQMGPDLFMRDVKLFSPSNYVKELGDIGPKWNERQNLTMGGNRVNADGRMPFGASRNSTIIDSLQNIFNYKKNVAPITSRDVVWSMQNSKQSAELAFDDYIDYDSFIIAEMTGLLNIPGPGGDSKYWSGWAQTRTTRGFSDTVRLQNAACAPATRWEIPPYGEVIEKVNGDKGRLEPAATGGIHGKGFWLGDKVGLRFVVPKVLPAKVAAAKWYAGIFVDCRFPTDTINRRLLTFPDNTSIVMTGGAKQLKYLSATGTVVGTVDLRPYASPIPIPDNRPSLLPDPGWAHLAWQIRNGGKDIDFLLNGILHTRISNLASPIFQMVTGNMIVGSDTVIPGFRGWIDDFKVFAHEVDPETACNLAGGTLVGMSQGYNGVFRAEANTYPNFNALADTELTGRLIRSGEPAHNNYANYHDYSKDNDHSRESGNAPRTLPSGLTSLRNSIHFPEGPVFHDRPRPDSTKNNFCMTCHIPQGTDGLNDAALTPGTANAILDPRRQPSQPPPLVFGLIPKGFIDNSKVAGTFPTAAPTPVAAGINIDQWMQPTFSAVAVKSIILVNVTNATNPIDVAEIRLNSNLVVKRQAGVKYAVRVNLDSAQGKVNIKHTFGGVSTSSLNRSFPYTASLPTSNQLGIHTIEADPSLNGAATTASFTFN